MPLLSICGSSLRSAAVCAAVGSLLALAAGCGHIRPETAQSYYFEYSVLNQAPPPHAREPSDRAEEDERRSAPVDAVASNDAPDEPVAARPAPTPRGSGDSRRGGADSAPLAAASPAARPSLESPWGERGDGPSGGASAEAAAGSSGSGADSGVVERGVVLSGPNSGQGGIEPPAPSSTGGTAGVAPRSGSGSGARAPVNRASLEELDAIMGGEREVEAAAHPTGPAVEAPAAPPGDAMPLEAAVAVVPGATPPAEEPEGGATFRPTVASPLGVQVAQSAERLVGIRHDFSSETLVQHVLRVHGLPMPEKGTKGWFKALYVSLQDQGLTYEQEQPLPGDLVFFHNSQDRNGDGRNNDWYSHCGVVIGVEADGRIQFVAYAMDEVQQMTLHLERPEVRRDESTGLALNSFLRPKRMNDPEFTHYLTGQLFAGFASVSLP